MKIWTLISVLVVTLIAAHQASACSRMTFPGSTLAAMADVIIEGHIDGIDGDTVIVSSRKVHKGSIPGTLEVKNMVTHYPDDGLARSCGLVIPRVGETYLLQFFDRLPGESKWTLTSEPLSLGDPLAADVVRARPVSTLWTPNSTDMWTKAFADKAVFEQDEELNIGVLFRNGATSTRTIRHRHWPESRQSSCSLEGDGIAGVRVRIAQHEIDDYFGRVMIASSRDFEVGPGGVSMTTLNHVSTESPGYGYKENSGFEYFPLKPGKHRVNVVCRGFVDEVLRAEGLRLEIRSPAAASTSGRSR